MHLRLPSEYGLFFKGTLSHSDDSTFERKGSHKKDPQVQVIFLCLKLGGKIVRYPHAKVYYRKSLIKSRHLIVAALK